MGRERERNSSKVCWSLKTLKNFVKKCIIIELGIEMVKCLSRHEHDEKEIKLNYRYRNFIKCIININPPLYKYLSVSFEFY